VTNETKYNNYYNQLLQSRILKDKR